MCSRSVGTDILHVGVFNLCGNPQCERTKMVYSYTPYSTVNGVFLTHSHRFWKSMRMCRKNSVNRTKVELTELHRKSMSLCRHNLIDFENL